MGELIRLRGVVDDERNAVQYATKNCLDLVRELGDLILEHRNTWLRVKSVPRSHDDGHWLGVRSELSVEILSETRKFGGSIPRPKPVKDVGLEVGLIDDAANLERGVFPKMGHPNALS